MPGPIKPKDVQTKKNKTLPQEVFDSFNYLILRDWSNDQATIVQGEVVDLIASALKISKSDVYAQGLLEIEDAYTKAGWKVKYDNPGYKDTYEAYFQFCKK